jgi:POT family proton-dependent oligopeptide transporter
VGEAERVVSSAGQTEAAARATVAPRYRVAENLFEARPMPKDRSPQLSRAVAATVADAPPTVAPAVPADTAFFGHPRGLATLFFTEFWERFSYYGMRALLILVLAGTAQAGGLGYDDRTSGAIYGLYTSFVYLLALPGGWVADRLLGQRRSVLYGGILIALGHFSLALRSVPTFFLGLVLIILGTGLLKPNVSTMVAELYPEGGTRRDAGFSIFYSGINLGAFLGPIVCGLLAGSFGWHVGFAAAGVGMVLGLVQYTLGGKYLGQAGLLPNAGEDAPGRSRSQLVLFGSLAVAVLLGILIATGTISVPIQGLANAAGVIIGGLALFYLLFQLVAGGLDAAEKKRMGAIFLLFVFSCLFWSGFEQAGSSLNLFAQRLTDRNIFGWEMPAPVLQSVNPVMIILFAPVFAWLWVALARSRREPSSPTKFSLGLLLLSLGFVVMVGASIATAGQSRQVSPMWLVLTYFFHTCGELCLSPVGLSTVTKLAPHRKVSQMMGIWFMSISLGNLVAGLIAGRFQSFPLPQLFGAVAATTAAAGLILALLVRPIKRLMTGVH